MRIISFLMIFSSLERCRFRFSYIIPSGLRRAASESGKHDDVRFSIVYLLAAALLVFILLLNICFLKFHHYIQESNDDYGYARPLLVACSLHYAR